MTKRKTQSPERDAQRNILGKDLSSPKYRQRREISKTKKKPKHKNKSWGDE